MFCPGTTKFYHGERQRAAWWDIIRGSFGSDHECLERGRQYVILRRSWPGILGMAWRPRGWHVGIMHYVAAVWVLHVHPTLDITLNISSWIDGLGRLPIMTAVGHGTRVVRDGCSYVSTAGRRVSLALPILHALSAMIVAVSEDAYQDEPLRSASCRRRSCSCSS